ncbi:TetR/AcrR family transcriptional regulator [Nocardioides sp. J54]|uniref:TetR/AcrR family transcriptional regulator n=1 Tax=Nocardioides sp. J54 TaxID=935866 RepID=UPI0006881A4C|nr:TetR/AcrR family transcriptional regulator [Nocardioides sp. J54]
MSERQVRRSNALREAWFTAANEILATEGYGALKLAPLCRRLGVTTGSFYHSFDNWQDFTDALLEAWLDERTQQTVDIVNQHDDPVTRLMMLAEASSQLLHRAEAAIRVWAGVDERVAAFQRDVDQRRYEVAHAALVEIVGEERAPQYAAWAMSTLVGFEMLAEGQDGERLYWALQQVLAAARAAA